MPDKPNPFGENTSNQVVDVGQQADQLFDMMVGQVYWLKQFGDAEYPDKDVIQKRLNAYTQDLDYATRGMVSDDLKQHPLLKNLDGDPAITPDPVLNEKRYRKHELEMKLQKQKRLQAEIGMGTPRPSY